MFVKYKVIFIYYDIQYTTESKLGVLEYKLYVLIRKLYEIYLCINKKKFKKHSKRMIKYKQSYDNFRDMPKLMVSDSYFKKKVPAFETKLQLNCARFNFFLNKKMKRRHQISLFLFVKILKYSVSVCSCEVLRD